jgi:hypothetical protein
LRVAMTIAKPFSVGEFSHRICVMLRHVFSVDS